MFSFCMYCCKERCAAIAISTFSALFMLCSGACIYLVVRLRDDSYLWDLQEDPYQQYNNQTSSYSTYDQPLQDISTVKSIVFWGLIGLPAFTILTGILGFTNAWYKSCGTIGWYSFLTLMQVFAYLLIGGLLMCVTVGFNRSVDQYCQSIETQQSQSDNGGGTVSGVNLIQPYTSVSTYEERYDGYTINFSRYMLNFLDKYQEATTTLVENYMCKQDCPCVKIENQTSRYPQGFRYPPIYQNGKYATFDQCYQDLLTDQKLQSALAQPLYQLIKRLESKYSCASLCPSTVPDFPFFQDVNQPRITESCQTGIKNTANETIGLLALILLINCLLVFCAFNAQYGLWKRRFQSRLRKNKQQRNNGGQGEGISGIREDRSRNYLVEEAP